MADCTNEHHTKPLADPLTLEALAALNEILEGCDGDCTRPGHRRGLAVLEQAGLRKTRGKKR